VAGAIPELEAPPPAAPAIVVVGSPEVLAPQWVSADGAAKLLGVSRSQFCALDADGRVPAPVDFGTGKIRRAPRWNVIELKVWGLLGCPARVRWEGMRTQALHQQVMNSRGVV
jgi:hypothetical protein